jgi:hypothetical protein
MSNLLKNLLIALVLSLVLFMGYIVFLRDGAGDDERFFSEQAALESENILSMLNEIKRTKVDASLFSNPLFLSLRDFRIDLGSEPTGRTNPFAPIE